MIKRKYHYFLWSLLAHILLVVYTYFFGIWYLIIGLLIGFLVHNLTATLYIHRILAHNYHTISNKWHWFFTILHPFLNLGSLIVNTAVHPYHHKYVDQERDPHDWKRLGIWRAFIKDYDNAYTLDRRYFAKLSKKPNLKWEHKYNGIIGKISIILFPFLPVAGFWLCNLLLFVVHIGPDKNNSAANIWWLWFLMWGEEWHELHHAKPELKKLHNLDIIYYIGKLIETKQ
jgi:stearoyl-CoA desaturase (delta-9 desaturase)